MIETEQNENEIYQSEDTNERVMEVISEDEKIEEYDESKQQTKSKRSWSKIKAMDIISKRTERRRARKERMKENEIKLIEKINNDVKKTTRRVNTIKRTNIRKRTKKKHSTIIQQMNKFVNKEKSHK